MKVSIILMGYNGEKYISKALESIKNQTYRNIELFAYDHGSQDKTMEIIKDYALHNPCNVLSYDRNPELDFKYTWARPVNETVKLCSGDLVYLMGQDDILDKNFILNNVVEFLNNSWIELFQSDIWWFNAHKEISIRDVHPHGWRYKNREELKRQMTQRCVVNSPSVMYSKKVLNDVGPWDGTYMNAADYEWFLRAIDKGYHIYNSEKFLGMFYGAHEKQATTESQKYKDGCDESKLKGFYKAKWETANT